MKPSKQILSSALAFGFAFWGLVACQNKGGGGGSSPNNPNNVFSYCTTCQGLGMGEALLPTVSSITTDGSLQFTLSLLGSSGNMGGNPKAVIYYQGPVSLTGSLRIQNGYILCGAPVGEYSFRPVSVSMMTALTLQGGQYEAVNSSGSRILFRLGTSVLYNDDGGGVSSISINNRIGLNMSVDSVNGMSCGSISTF